MRILVTGGAGYIGSHTTLELLSQSHEVLIADNYCNSSPIAVDRIRKLSNGAVSAAEIDLVHQLSLRALCVDFQPDSVIHFAGLKAVGESAEVPLSYYRNNLLSTLSLLEAMDECGCTEIVFSSSATVYGEPQYLPLDEDHVCAPTNAYGRTKYFIEEILKDWVSTGAEKKAVALRYFNPVGAHPSAELGEDPLGTANNLMPYISQVAVGKLDALNIFGNDYDTPDGTGVRDYLHVVDLARAHVAALNSLSAISGFEPINLGTGSGTSVREVVAAFEEASGVTIPTVIAPRRPGDVAACWADPSKAKTLLNWEAQHSIQDMCRSAWAWQSANPEGYI